MKKILFLAVVAFTFVTIQSCTESTAATFNKVEPEKRKEKKILPHLVSLLDKLESGEVNNYDWTNNTSCNVGLMAQIATNRSGKEIKEDWNSDTSYDRWAKNEFKANKTFSSGAWTNRVSYNCGISNKPYIGVIGDLQGLGFTASDITSLEYLSNKEILKDSGIDTSYISYFQNKENLILYLRSWIKTLNNQHGTE